MKRLSAHHSLRLVAAVVGLLVVALIFPLRALAAPPSPLLPGSDRATDIANLFWIVLGIAAVVFVIVEALIIFAVVKYRRQYPDEVPEQIDGNSRLELIWTVIPALIMIALFWVTLNTLQKYAYDKTPEGAMVVEVTGRQWFWEFTYPETEIKLTSLSNDLYLPADEPIEFEIRSNDVIHSFWVPELAGKVDAIPGHTNHLWFTASEGVYAGQCAEFCGQSHYDMLFNVNVVPRDEFNAWMDEQIVLASQFQPIGTDLETPLPIGDATIGETLFTEEYGCNACHSLDGSTLVGPSLQGISQRAGERIDGYTAEQYLRESILLPCDYVVDGFECLMPQDYGDRMEAEDLANIIAYLLTQ